MIRNISLKKRETRGDRERRTALQNCRYQPHVSHVFHSSPPQLARLCHAFSVITTLACGFGLRSDGEGAKHATKPSRVRDSADFCSRVRLAKAFSAVMSAGLSTAAASSSDGNILNQLKVRFSVDVLYLA
jgi:hypothetical protein